MASKVEGKNRIWYCISWKNKQKFFPLNIPVTSVGESLAILCGSVAIETG